MNVTKIAVIAANAIDRDSRRPVRGAAGAVSTGRAARSS